LRGAALLRTPLPLRRGVSITAYDLRAGDIIEYGDDASLWRVASSAVSRQGQGRSNIQLELRHARAGTKKDVRLRADELVEKAELDPPARLDVLYVDGASVVLMDPASFEQTELPLAAFGAGAPFLADGMPVTVETYKGAFASASMPQRAEVVVVETLPENTAKNSRDVPAKLVNGIALRVPKFVRAGDKVVVLTATGEYVGKATPAK
jgi:elongation factor P